MKIEYELKPLTSRGVLLSKEPAVLIDRKVILSFSLPSKTVKSGDEYFAIITDQDGNEHTLRLNNMQCALPDKLIKPQALKIQVIKVEECEAVKRWNCQGIRLALLDDMLRLTYEVGIDYNALQEQYSALVGDIEQLTAKEQPHEQQITALQAENENKTAQIAELERKLNEAISAINNLSERVEFMENNYNPLEV